MPQNRRADALFFCLDFQVNAAIVLMLENINELKSLRLEGNYEDIDIELCSGKHILAQAKAIVRASEDFKHVKENLKKALITLSEGSQNISVKELIFVTNSPNPINDGASKSIFYGHAIREFKDLPASSQEIISNYLSEIDNPLNKDQFVIHVIPFETDRDAERFKVIWSCIGDFLGKLNIETGIRLKLHRIWKDELWKNGSKNDPNVVLTKKHIIWPIIVIVTDPNKPDPDFVGRFDSIVYDEALRCYINTIEDHCERVTFFTQILFDYQSYEYSGKEKDKIINFVDECWSNYLSEFEGVDIDDEVMEALIKIVVFNVLRRRRDIDKIKKGCSYVD